MVENEDEINDILDKVDEDLEKEENEMDQIDTNF